MIIKAEDIVGYLVGEECVCCECINAHEEVNVSQNEIITRDVTDSDDALYFCDRCNRKV